MAAPPDPGPRRNAGPAGARLHIAARLEDRVYGAIGRRLRTTGWRPRVQPYTGYGGEGWVRVLARVLLAPPATAQRTVENERGWRRFVSMSAAGVEVSVEIGGEQRSVVSARDGYVDVRLPAAVAPGWTVARLTVEGAPPVEAPVHVVGPASTAGLVSDIDDTVIITALPRPALAFWNTFVLQESLRRPVPGMAKLYQELVGAETDLFVCYLSTGAWNTAPSLQRFLDRHGYPRGPILLTDWGATKSGWFRSGREHKRAELRRLFADLPQVRWLLVGDDGQHDPAIYSEAAEAAPDRVRGVAIRVLTPAQQVLRHGTTASPSAPAQTPAAVVQMEAPDGYELIKQFRDAGLFPPSTAAG